MLGSFLFRGDDVFKSIDVLSGGEKSRIALLELLLRPVNLLILDEPTNHLDMHSKDVLLDALKDFGGTVVFVSHDRGFIEGLATRVLELTPGRYRIFPGDYRYYMERLEAEAAGDVPVAVAAGAAKTASGASARSSQPASAGSADDGGSGKEAWAKRKQEEAQRRKIEKEVARLEKLIAETEAKKGELEASLSLPEVYSNGEKAKEVQKKISALEEELDKLNADWEAAAEQL
jgi:ATP-binding cassette subfamily F protein 3